MTKNKKFKQKPIHWYVRFQWRNEYLHMKDNTFDSPSDDGYVTSFQPKVFNATLSITADSTDMYDNINKRVYVMRPSWFRKMACQGVIQPGGTVTGEWGWTRQGTRPSIVYIGPIKEDQ